MRVPRLRKRGMQSDPAVRPPATVWMHTRPRSLPAGSTGMIGKGKRDQGVVDAMKEFGAVYFAAIGGAGALLARCVKKAEVVAYEDLGAEAIRRMEVEDFPVTVVIDTLGRNLYETGRKAYLASREKI